LACWYEGQGEQQCDVWFEARSEEYGTVIPVPITDVSRPGGYREILPNGDVIVYCRP
jgi:hypothetical protein